MYRTRYNRPHTILMPLVSACVVILGLELVWSAIIAPQMDGSQNFGTPLWYLFSFVAGMTMAVLPCTLPLVFLILPLSRGEKYLRTLGTLLAFGTGTVLMFSAYGALAAFLGNIGMTMASARGEHIMSWAYVLTGVFVYVLALSEAGLFGVQMRSYSGKAPKYLRARNGYAKAFLVGLFLGNIGIMTSHAAMPLLLVKAASSGDTFFGWSLFFVNALGRMTPFVFLVLVGAAGRGMIEWLLERKEYIRRASASMMIAVAGIVLTTGLFTHEWLAAGGVGQLLGYLCGDSSASTILSTDTGILGQPIAWGSWFLVFLWTIPLWWHYLNERKRIFGTPALELKRLEEDARYIEAERRGIETMLHIHDGDKGERIRALEARMDSLLKERALLEEAMRYGAESGLRDDSSQRYEEALLRLRFWFSVVVSVLLVAVFVYFLPV